MDAKKIIGIGLIGYFVWKLLLKRISNAEETAQTALDNSGRIDQNWQDYLNDQDSLSIAPAEKYLEITPYVEFSEITGNEWTGKFIWKIKNTSPDISFNITRIKSNIQICGYTSIFIPGNKDTMVRVNPGKTVEIASTWQDGKWYQSNNTAAKDEIRRVLRADMDKNLPVLECDCKVWCRGTGSVEDQSYIFSGLEGYARLNSGAKEYWSNQGENAVNWDD